MVSDNKPKPMISAAKRGRGLGSDAPPFAVAGQPRNRPHDVGSHVKRPHQPATSRRQITSQEADVKWRALLLGAEQSAEPSAVQSAPRRSRPRHERGAEAERAALGPEAELSPEEGAGKGPGKGTGKNPGCELAAYHDGVCKSRPGAPQSNYSTSQGSGEAAAPPASPHTWPHSYGDGGSFQPHHPIHLRTPQPAPLLAPGSQADQLAQLDKVLNGLLDTSYGLPPGISEILQTTLSDHQPTQSLQELFATRVMCDYTPRHPKRLTMSGWVSVERLSSQLAQFAPAEVAQLGPSGLKQMITESQQDHPAFEGLKFGAWCKQLKDDRPQASDRALITKFAFEHTPHK